MKNDTPITITLTRIDLCNLALACTNAWVQSNANKWIHLHDTIMAEIIAADEADQEAQQEAPSAEAEQPIDDATLSAIAAIITEADRMRGAYFFQPPQTAGGRRSYERYHSHDTVTWTENGHTYTAAYTVSCTCSNVYASGNYTRDGKKATLTTIRNSYRRMTA